MSDGKVRGQFSRIETIDGTRDEQTGAPRQKLELSCGHTIIRAPRSHGNPKLRRVLCPICAEANGE